MLAIIVRTVILYLLVVFSLRFMGKKQIGQLEPSELAVAIMISELASIPMESKDIPLVNGVVPVLILACCEVLISWLLLKNVKIRKYISGRPSILIDHGVIQQSAMKELRFTADDLLEEMRMNGIVHFSDIQYAIMETNGQVSFILQKAASTPTVQDFSLSLPEEQMPFPIVVKGEVYKENLKRIHRTENWLNDELKNLHIANKKDILLLCANEEKVMFTQLKEKKQK